jgi:hypothetical protein
MANYEVEKEETQLAMGLAQMGVNNNTSKRIKRSHHR